MEMCIKWEIQSKQITKTIKSIQINKIKKNLKKINQEVDRLEGPLNTIQQS